MDDSRSWSPTGYDHDTYRQQLRRRRITPLIARRGTRDDNSSARWVVEQPSLRYTSSDARAPRWERRLDIYQGFIALACAMICWRRLVNHRRPIC